MPVPNTNTFTLQDVVDEVVPTTDNLVDCFSDATAAEFDPLYAGSKDRLSNFRNYGGIKGTLTNVGTSTTVNYDQTLEGNKFYVARGGSILSHLIYTTGTINYEYPLNNGYSYCYRIVTEDNYDYIITLDRNNSYSYSISVSRDSGSALWWVDEYVFPYSAPDDIRIDMSSAYVDLITDDNELILIVGPNYYTSTTAVLKSYFYDDEGVITFGADLSLTSTAVLGFHFQNDYLFVGITVGTTYYVRTYSVDTGDGSFTLEKTYTLLTGEYVHQIVGDEANNLLFVMTSKGIITFSIDTDDGALTKVDTYPIPSSSWLGNNLGFSTTHRILFGLYSLYGTSYLYTLKIDTSGNVYYVTNTSSVNEGIPYCSPNIPNIVMTRLAAGGFASLLMA